MIVVTVAVDCDVCETKFETEAHFSAQVEGTLYLEQFGYWEVVDMALAEGWTMSLADFDIYCPLHGPDDEVKVRVAERGFRPTTVTVDRSVLVEEITQLTNSISYAFHPGDMTELTDETLIAKLDILKRLMAIRTKRQALIDEDELTAEDCLITAVFGPDTPVEYQIDSMNAKLLALALQFNEGC